MYVVGSGIALLVVCAIFSLSAIAQTTEEFIEALSPESPQSEVRTRGLGGVQAKPSARQKAMHLKFDLNSADLTVSAKETLDQLGRALQAEELRKYAYRLEGHTCDRGSYALNNDLSKRRALAAQQYLVHKFRLPVEQLEVVWFGESQPAVPNNDESARRQNRRVMIVNTMKPLDLVAKVSSQVLQIRRLRDGQESLIADGEVMTASDRYALEFKTAKDRYVYIYQPDSLGKLTPIFPNVQLSSLNNPLQPNAFYRVPGPDQWFFLDENKGAEEILMMTCDRALNDPRATAKVMAGNMLASNVRGLGGIHRKKPKKAEAAATKKASSDEVVENAPEPEVSLIRRCFIHE